jgi:hypothetical protein
MLPALTTCGTFQKFGEVYVAEMIAASASRHTGDIVEFVCSVKARVCAAASLQIGKDNRRQQTVGERGGSDSKPKLGSDAQNARLLWAGLALRVAAPSR